MPTILKHANVLAQTYAPDTLRDALADDFYVAQFKGEKDSERGWTFLGCSNSRDDAIRKARSYQQPGHVTRVIAPDGKVIWPRP